MKTTVDLPESWDRSVPTLLVANHTNWWDGFLAFRVSRSLRLTFQVLMALKAAKELFVGCASLQAVRRYLKDNSMVEIDKLEGERAHPILRRILDYYVAALVTAALAISLLAGDVIRIMASPEFHPAGATVPLLINPAFAETTLGQNLPLFASVMLTIALVGLFVLVIVEHRIVPQRPAHWGPMQRIASYVQWLGLPFVGIFFSNLPALDAQTRLLTGRYLEYRVTEKA